MPVIRLEYDNTVVTEPEANAICSAVQQIVAAAPGIKEVFVYGNSSHIKVNVAPIEIWIELSAHIATDALVKYCREGISEWKAEANFPHTINLTLIPMNWKLELNI